MPNVTTEANAANLLVSSNPATFHGLTGYNAKGSDQFLQIHDSATLPENGSVPKITIKIYAGSNFSLDYDARGRKFDHGIYVCNSSTQATLTIGSADCWIDAQVEPH